MTTRRYCIISPCRDEARFARRTLDSVVRQSEAPSLLVIVDDGSSDATPGILAEYAARYSFVRVLRRSDRGDRALGAGVVEAFLDGLNTVQLASFDYVCKLDLDLDLPPGYFAHLMDRMEANPRIGTCSGKPYFLPPGLADAQVRFPLDERSGVISEKLGDENAVGAAKFYRTACFQQVGGFVRGLMWDGIDGHRCRQMGWIAVSWDEPALRFMHLRPMGTSHRNWWTGRRRWGEGQYFMGTGPVYMLASAVYRMSRPPRIVGGIAMVIGYLDGMFRRQPRYGDAEFRRFLRRYQWSCLLRGKPRATKDLEERQSAAWNPLRGVPGT